MPNHYPEHYPPKENMLRIGLQLFFEDLSQSEKLFEIYPPLARLGEVESNAGALNCRPYHLHHQLLESSSCSCRLRRRRLAFRSF